MARHLQRVILVLGMTMTSLIKSISIDIETYSSIDLKKCGMYKYSESSDFEILLFGYAINGGEVQVVDLAGGEKIPSAILACLTDDSVIKYAFNAAFERVCLSRYLGLSSGTYLNPISWRCTMVWAATLGLPLTLKGVGEVLNLDAQKMDEGKELIKYFCTPCKPTKVNGGRTRNLPCHALDKWVMFKAYNKRDVEVEMAIQEKLHKHPVPDFIWREYHLDQVINDRGVKVDRTLVDHAINIDSEDKSEISTAMQNLSDIENPNSTQQLKMWLLKQGVETESLSKKDVSRLLEEVEPGDIASILELRSQLAKSSVKKYEAMRNCICKDRRAHGMFQFYGANRSGRWSGRLIQLQNLPQNHLSDLAEARALARNGDLQALRLLYENVQDTLSQLIRTAFIPADGYRFIVADFSAIEARVIAWYAKEQWRLDTFAKGKDIYCASASQMFKVPVEKHGINGHLRQKGKIAELALGYGGSEGALKAMGAIEMGLEESELKPLVTAWRTANPNITKFWWAVDKAVKDAIKNRTTIRTYGLVFTYQGAMLYITLPSGRKLAYVKPRIEDNIYGGESVTYMGIGATKKWERIESYGPKFVENIVQATARDILANSMQSLKDYRIVMHIHDEVVIEATKDISIDEISQIMSKNPTWCQDLCLTAAGYECEFYQKD